MKKKKRSNGGRYTYICPACHNSDPKTMTIGQRTAYAECDCGFVWDAETGQGHYRNRPKPVVVDLSKLGQ
jgi:hypothetical protein